MSDLDLRNHQALDACIHCGLCLPACPTYRETGNEAESPRGRIHMIAAAAEGRLTPDAGLAEHLDACVGCRACETACPAGVQYGSLLELARAQLVEPARQSGLRTRVWRPLIRQVLPHPGRFAALARPAGLARRVLVRNGEAPSWLPAVLRRPLEVLPAPQPREPLPEWTPAEGEEKGVVAFLAGCAMPVLYAGANAATVRMLARAGYRVWVPPNQACCGAIHLHDGDPAGARNLARRNVEALAGPGVVAVVANAAGCGAALKGYGELLGDEPAFAGRAQAIAAKTRDFAEFLAGETLPAAAPLDLTVTYHDPCHLAHGQKVKDAPRRLLKAIPGVRYVELREADWCCGGAGSYTMLQPEMSDKLLAHKLRHIADTEAEVVVTANAPCLMQIGMGLARSGEPVRLMHLAELLDAAHSK